MMRRTPLPALAGILAAFWGAPAFARGPSCSPMVIDVDPSVGVRWPSLVGELRDALEVRDDIDHCARVALSQHDAVVVVEVVLPDGRSAVRSVSRREDVAPALEALLLLPQPGAEERPSSVEGATTPLPRAEPTPTRAVPPALRSLTRALAVQDVDAAVGRYPSRVRIDVSAATGARFGDGQTSVGVAVLSFLDLSGWLVGFEGRFDRYHSAASPAWADALEVAILAGRRFRFRRVSLDVTAGPALVPQGTTTFTTSSSSMSRYFTESTSSIAPRLLLGARVSFGALSTLRTFVGLEGELGPARLGDATDVPGAPRLPIWTLGLALGATLGTR